MLFSVLAIILLLPVMIVVAIAIILESRGGPIYVQKRVGYGGRLFNLFKFRSMRTGSDLKGKLTIGAKDTRITNVGYVIRKYKLDEVPQLFNVILNDMSIVGPRPEVEKYVSLYNSEQKLVLTVKPGISDYASLIYIDENDILSRSDNPERTYIETIMPRKIRLNMIYINKRSVATYFDVIFRTIFQIFK